MPLVSPNLLSDPADIRTMIDGQRFFLQAFHTTPLKERIREVRTPDPINLSDDAILKHCKRFVKTNYHPSGTCRMGPSGDPMAVLDPRLRVRGIEGLRVCDLSAMPNINAGNTNAPALMMGSRCAEFVSTKAQSKQARSAFPQGA
jgi:choline dehydrogenase-like flavoprotein